MNDFEILTAVVEKRLDELEEKLESLKSFKKNFENDFNNETLAYYTMLIGETEFLIEVHKSGLQQNNKVIELMKIAESDSDITKRIKALSELAEILE